MTRSQEYLCGELHRFTYLVHNRPVPPLIVCPECLPSLHKFHVEALDSDPEGGATEVSSRLDTVYVDVIGSTSVQYLVHMGEPVISAVLSKTIVRGNADFAQREKERLTKRADEHNASPDAVEESIETGRAVMKKATASL